MTIYVTKFAFYKPSPDNPGEMPKLEYVDSLFRRRLSQLTRMTIEVVHDLVSSEPENAKLKLVFGSFRGEIARQVKINKGLVEDADVMPAPFSLSVFNTPPAAATIALGMKAGYTAVYPGNGNFLSALMAASSSVMCGSEKSVIFVWADEKIPEEYRDCVGYNEEPPFAFACVLSSEKTDSAIEIDIEETVTSKKALSPADFLAFLESKGNN